MEASIHHVGDLGEAASAVESLVGHSLGSDEVIYIATLGANADRKPAERDAAWDELETIVAQTLENAAKSGQTPDQIDALIDAECAAVRHERGK